MRTGQRKRPTRALRTRFQGPASEATRRALHEVDAYPHGLHPALVPGLAADEQPVRYGTDRAIVAVAAAFVLGFILWGVISTESLTSVSETVLGWVVSNTGWMFNVLAAVIILFMLVIGFSRFGRIPLGRDDEEPEFSTLSWVAMLFSAGIGIGLFFFGAYEPMTHFLSPPPGTGVEPGTYDAMRTALAQSVFHWGLHAWAIYALVGASIAYGAYRRGRVPLISRIFVPLIGRRRAEGPGGRLIDMFAIVATLFGTAASLGIGTLQIGRGLEIVTGAGRLGNTVLLVVMTVLTIGFVVSAVSGVARGIRYLSNINMTLALVLGFFVFVAGPTVFLFNLVPTVVAQYFGDMFHMISRSAAWGPESATFVSTWTVFYWAWWVSWSPFVGIFIARISRGRTLRQFVGVVLLVPTAVFVLAFSVLGGTAMQQQRGGADLAASESPQDMLFNLLGSLPLSAVTTALAMFCVSIFFITSADSASFVMGVLSQRGTTQPDARIVVFWGLLMMGIAVVMLLIGGNVALEGLQNLIIGSALPFAAVLVLMMVAFWKDLQTDPLTIRYRYARTALSQAVRTGVEQHGDEFALRVREAPEGSGAGAEFDSKHEDVTDWYQRTDEHGDPVEYDYSTGEYAEPEDQPEPSRDRPAPPEE